MLQSANSIQELWLITLFQWFELWFKVLDLDLRAALADAGRTFESTKLLRRGSELFQLLDSQVSLAEAVLLRELKATETLKPSARGYSDQFAYLLDNAPSLAGWQTSDPLLQDARADYAARLDAFRIRWEKLIRSTLIPRDSAPSYSEWLHLPVLLDLQQGVKADWTPVGGQPSALMQPKRISVDENMFVVVHQCFELWFKVILEHVDRAIRLIEQDEILEANRLLRRVVPIQRLLNRQIQIPATMLPMDFALFREQKMERDGAVLVTGLSPASGTESYQFREIEIACGLGRDPVFKRYLQGTDGLPIRLLTPRQSERLGQSTLPEVFDAAVERRGITDLASLFSPARSQNPDLDLADLAYTLIDLDEAFRMWRVSHVGMVEKMIGGKSGTGFLGPEYLMETAGLSTKSKNRILEEIQRRPRFFEELWAARTRLSAY